MKNSRPVPLLTSVDFYGEKVSYLDVLGLQVVVSEREVEVGQLFLNMSQIALVVLPPHVELALVAVNVRQDDWHIAALSMCPLRCVFDYYFF